VVAVQAGRERAQLGFLRGVLDSVLVSKRDPAELIELGTLTRPNRELVGGHLPGHDTFSYLEAPKTIDAFVSAARLGRLPAPYSYLLYARLGDLLQGKGALYGRGR